jgi:predicted glycoside hydrolase/deacetylase ChbG (UPF0249 family)
LVVNADDFGLSEGVNDGIVRAHRHGIVTSASLMVLWPAAADAVKRAGKIALGLHIDLGEWAYRNGQWIALYERVSLEERPAVEAEVTRQLDEFVRLAGKIPTHIDSHQHVHMYEPVRSITKRLADKLSVPLRGYAPGISYSGNFYGQSGEGEPFPDGISVPALIRLLAELPPGATELGCHPGEDAQLDSKYRQERFQEVQALCDPRVREAIGNDMRCLSGYDAAHDVMLNNQRHDINPVAVRKYDAPRRRFNQPEDNHVQVAMPSHDAGRVARRHAREAARRSSCINNLKQIGLAVLNFEQSKKLLPPGGIWNQGIVDLRNGGSLYVHILPMLEEPALYGAFDFRSNNVDDATVPGTGQR